MLKVTSAENTKPCKRKTSIKSTTSKLEIEEVLCPRTYILPFRLKKNMKAYSTIEKLSLRIESSIK